VASTQYYCASSLDGYIAASDDTIEWLTGYQGSYEGADAVPIKGSYDDFYRDVGALVSGSVTYEFILDQFDQGKEWPYKGKPFWILSSRDLPVPKAEQVDLRVVEGDVAELCDQMRASAGEGNLWVVGGGNVASQFADAGLLDEVRLTVVPVVLGEGKPLFDRSLPGGPMQLTAVIPRDSGMVELRYELTG
jgi:dihydrofolate reductase